MAGGRMAFSGNTAAIIHEAILNRTPIPVGRVNPDLPSELERIVNKALEKDRKLRYQHASEMRGDLQRLKRDTESGVSAVRPAVSAIAVAKSSSFRRGAMGLALLAFVLLAVPNVWAQDKGEAKPVPEEQTGLKVGEKAPKFTLKDQEGNERALDEFLKKGKVALVFYRSADW